MMNFGSHTIGADDEYEKLVIRMNPPRVTVDNNSSKKATLVKVDSANKHGSLLEVVQVLIDLNLTIKRAYISSDGKWFMDVFHVVDQEGNKLYDCEVIERIQQSLGPRACSFRSVRNSIDTQSGSKQYTSIELVGRDRPGLLSEISAVLTNLKCNIVAAEVWTHNSRMASVIYITDELTGGQIEESDQLAKIKRLLCYVLKGDREKQSAKTNNSVGVAHTERRLHQMMYDDQNFNRDGWVFEEEESGEKIKLVITLENCTERGYTVVYLRCKDRPKLLFDTVFTLTDMLYVVFHATIISEGPEAYQEYYIRHQNGFPISSEVEKQRLIHCLEAAIRRRSTEGIRLELCSKDRVGLLSDVTRIFRENGLSVIRAEVSTKGSRASNVFYVTDASGCRVQSQTIEAVRNQIGKIVLCIKDDTYLKAPTDESGRFSLSNLFRSQSERFLHNLGFMRSCS